MVSLNEVLLKTDLAACREALEVVVRWIVGCQRDHCSKTVACCGKHVESEAPGRNDFSSDRRKVGAFGNSVRSVKVSA